MGISIYKKLFDTLGRYRIVCRVHFTDKYNVTKLVYFEETSDIKAAIEREKQLKKWRREKKNQLVELTNLNWDDLSEAWV